MFDEAFRSIRFYNSWSREIENFVPIDDDVVRMYSCGPTVYNYAHVGNLRAYTFTDLLRRTLNWKGWSTLHVINITDVGHLTSDADVGVDKLEEASIRENRTIWKIAEHYTTAFKKDLVSLNVLEPSIWSTATDHVEDMIGFAMRLHSSGYAYETDSGLYFDTSKVPEYGRLALIDEEGRREGARVAIVKGKRNSNDFAIWRRSEGTSRRQMEWSSPWGIGAPGWHLECSVMSMKYLGKEFDIHTGGIDHREVHHCNEIAQNQGYSGTANPGAKFWMHNNFLVDRSGKMSKSKGDFTTLPTLLSYGVHPLAFRLLCLSAHYRNEMEFTIEGLLGALKRLKRMVKVVTLLKSQIAPCTWCRAIEEIRSSRGASFIYQRDVLEGTLAPNAKNIISVFDAYVSNDLATPSCLTVLDDVLNSVDFEPDVKLRIVASFDLVLGLSLLELSPVDLSLRPADATLANEEIELLISAREGARGRKDYATADKIRQQLSSAGVLLMDAESGANWEWIPSVPAP
ncbi:cysteine--tRNA ligase [Agrobacterium rhizogenes]|nr:cysteine--tRNA ligase [Rhizobium rhizogenes]